MIVKCCMIHIYFRNILRRCNIFEFLNLVTLTIQFKSRNKSDISIKNRLTRHKICFLWCIKKDILIILVARSSTLKSRGLAIHFHDKPENDSLLSNDDMSRRLIIIKNNIFWLKLVGLTWGAFYRIFFWGTHRELF